MPRRLGPPPPPRPCENPECNIVFAPNPHTPCQKFCSHACGQRGWHIANREKTNAAARAFHARKMAAKRAGKPKPYKCKTPELHKAGKICVPCRNAKRRERFKSDKKGYGGKYMMPSGRIVS